MTKQGVRTEEPYYDRQLALGDCSWKDTELRAELIFHHHFADHKGRNPNGPPYLSHAHTSFNLRWAGHPDDGMLPRRNWQNLGSLIALRTDLATQKVGSYWWMHFGHAAKGKPAKRSIVANQERFKIVPEKRYHYCMRAETETQYSAKVWMDGEEEPTSWQMQEIDLSDTVASGSAVFVVHHSDVTLCRIQVNSLPALPLE